MTYVLRSEEDAREALRARVQGVHGPAQNGRLGLTGAAVQTEHVQQCGRVSACGMRRAPLFTNGDRPVVHKGAVELVRVVGLAHAAGVAVCALKQEPDERILEDNRSCAV